MMKYFPETKKQLKTYWYLILLYILICLSFASIKGYLNAFLFAKIIDSIYTMSITQFGVFLLLHCIFLLVAYFITRCNLRVYDCIRNKLTISTDCDIQNTIAETTPIFFEDDNWVYDYKRVSGLSSVFSDLIFTSTTVISSIFTLLSYYLYMHQFVGNRAYMYILIIIPSLVKSTLFSIYYTKFKRKTNINKQIENRFFKTLLNPIAISESKIFGSETFIFKKWNYIYKTNFDQALMADIKFSPVSLMCTIIVFIIGVFTYNDLYTLMQQGAITLGILLTLIPYIITIIGQSDNTTQNFGSILLTLQEYRDIIKLMDSQKTAKNNKKDNNIIEKPSKTLIELNSISFRYPNSENLILQKMTFNIDSGETVAIVGLNGAGKSTLMKIMAGYFPPSSGSVRYNGTNTLDICANEIKSSISFLFQHPVQYPDTFAENIVSEKDDRFSAAILRDFDEEFEKLYSSTQMLGWGFTDSRGLSGGQWQKVAILRALQKNSNIYFFDEPTAALDPIAEVKVYDLFRKYTEGKTVILATHRLGLAKKADKIIVIDKQNIVGVGNHETLINSCSIYSDLFNKQRKWYDNVDVS